MSEKDRGLKEFLGEAEDILDQLNEDVFKLSDDLPKGSVDPDTLNSTFRSIHTLKGISGIFGFTALSKLSHNLESVLDSLRLGKIPFTTGIVEILFDGLKIINRLLKEKGDKNHKKTVNEEDDEVNDFIENLTKAVEKASAEDSSDLNSADIDKDILKVLTEYEEHRLKENIKQGRNILMINVSFVLDNFDNELTELNTKIKTIGEIIATLPSASPAEKDSILFDILVGTDSPKDAVEGLVKKGKVEIIKQTVSERPSQSPEEPKEPSKDDKTTLHSEESIKSISNTVRVDIERLNSIMNTVGEISLCKTIIVQISEQLKMEQGFTGLAVDLHKVSKDLERKLNDLQLSLLEARMVPLSQLFDRLRRMVKKLSIEEGKEIDVEIEGSDTELDKLIIEELADPVMHLIRNSIDHGIEPPEVRTASGKTEKGTIKLNAYNRGNHVVIDIEDDGRGIDTEKIKKQIIAKGLESEESVLNLNEEDLLNYIFLSGFSTKEEVSQLSGRGVGMDVVKQNIARLSGTIDIETWKGKGSRFTLTLPITLAIIKALLITAHNKEYAIPINSVLEILSIPRSEIKTIEKREVIDLRGHTLPLLSLSDFFNLKGSSLDKETIEIIVVGLAENRLGILADTLIGEQDVVIKPLGRLFSNVQGIAGATDLGDRKTILVLDVGGIIGKTLKSSAKQEVASSILQ